MILTGSQDKGSAAVTAICISAMKLLLAMCSLIVVMSHGQKRVRHSGRLLGRPNAIKCSRRPRQLKDSRSGHYYFISEATNFKGHEAGWLDARNLCRERCMDLISIETHHEFRMVQDIIRKHQLNSIWTSGRLCNFKGCEAKHLQPRRIKGWFWSGSGKSIAATNSTPPGWPQTPWSRSGYIGQFLDGEHSVPQPDNAEHLLNKNPVTQEACISVNNNWYQDGISWHDTACYHKKPFICEDSDVLMRKARTLSPSVKIV